MKQENKIVSRETWKFTNYFQLFLESLYISALFNAFIAILQFFAQRDVYLYFLGESHLQIGSQNIATINFFGDKILRAYGLFPHPNVLAAFLLLTLTMAFLFRDFFVSRETKWSRLTSMFHVKQLGIFFISIALFLTFSKVALILGGILYLLSVSRETKEKYRNMFHVKHLILAIVIFGIIIFLNQKSFNEREFSLIEYAKTNAVTFFGNGIGTSYFYQELSLKASMNPWVMQPVHSGLLIVLGELGIFGLLVYTYLFLGVLFSSSKKMFHVKQRCGSQLMIVFILILALGDHYFFTLPQGIFLFWIFLALGSVNTLVLDNK
ncbi:MAG: hypothetical protein KIH67_000520 [Candidatus Moranbacteria bacterium]|nr:hypothetical protein [Candidatus Moranbacteria bacterium]